VAKSLVIVESPAKARTIAKFLGREFRVESCMGHVRDLPEKALGVDIEAGFRPHYQVLPSRRHVIASLREAAKGAESVYLAPDPDREGEAIAWHLSEALKLPKSRVRRVTFNEITPRGVRTGFAQPRDIDMNLVNAQQARRILDRVVGYQLSPLLWRKVGRGLSAGRVQSVAVRLVVEREREIQAFKPEEYWKITARLLPAEAADDSAAFEAELFEFEGQKVRIAAGPEAEALVARLRDAEYAVASVETQRKRAGPYPPFATSQLQQAASVRLGFRPKKTMMLAQQLYEGVEVGAEGSIGLITYMRTDSFRIAEEALTECRALIGQRFGERYLAGEPRRYRSRRGAQEAHEAIRPADAARAPESLAAHLTPDQLKLYRLIWERFVACQMADAEYDVTRAVAAAGPARFQASGRTVVFDGHTRVYTTLKRREDDEQVLPALRGGQALRCLDITPSQHFTKPPPRYTEASLVKTLEREGIGRPSTYAQIISTIQERGYAEVRDKVFYAKELGTVTNDALLPFFGNIINTRFTSQLESHLDNVEEAKADWQSVLSEFYDPFRADLAKAEAEMPSVKKQLAAETSEVCEKCGSPMVIRLSKTGRFMACSAFPKCRNTKALDEEGEPVTVEAIEERCPQCGEPLTVRTGRRGKFIGCSAFPKCRYTRPAEGEAPAQARAPRPAPEPTGEACPRCGKPLVAREGQRGKFIGCSAYPKCRFTRNIEGAEAPQAETTDVKCDKCGSPMVIRSGRRGRFLACSAYPKCRSTKPIAAAGPAPPPQDAGRACPECGKPLVIRVGGRGKFIGCSGYPTCRHTESVAEPPPDQSPAGRQ